MRLDQMEATTRDWEMMEGGKAMDLFFQTSFLLNRFLKEKKGLWKRPTSGNRIKVALRFDGNKSGFYARGGTIDSTMMDAITAVFFQWKHAYGNATVLRIDQLKNDGPEGTIDLMTEELHGAKESLRDDLANSFYDGPGQDSGTRLTGLGACCDSDDTATYASYTANEIVSADGTTKVWSGNETTTETLVALDEIRDLKAECDYGKGKNDEPDLMATTKAIFNYIKAILLVQQQYTTKDSEAVKAGFVGVNFEGTDIFPDRYMADKNAFLLNSDHIGFAVHKKGYLQRSPWRILEGSAEDKTCKHYFDGNVITDNRRAHNRHSNLIIS